MSAPKASCYSTLVKSKLALDIVWSSAMRRFPTVLVLQASSLLTALGTLEKLMPARGSLGDDIVEQIRQQLLPLKELCTQLGLRVCEEHTKEILQRLQGMQLSEFTRASMELKNNLQRELNGMVCLWLPADKEGYFQKTSLFGAEVSKAFPSSSFDIEEAGMCIALSRGTACVFHLMRVMEVGLRSFARNLGISVPDDKNWGHILREISAATTRLPDGTTTEKEHKEFCSGATAHLSSVKEAWRNPVMHVRGAYTGDQAEDIFTHVRSFIRQLATRIQE